MSSSPTNSSQLGGSTSDCPTETYHPFLRRELITPVRRSIHSSCLLADYRARGGYTKKRTEPFRNEEAVILDYDLKADGAIVSDKLKETNSFSILYSSYGKSDEVSFCEGPLIKTWEFGSPEDLSLRSFLELNCFTNDDKCHHASCSNSIYEHSRKFCHSRGCIKITQKQMKSYAKLAANNIIIWTWCDRCKNTSPYVSLSEESWNMSFGKFLQLRIYAHELAKPTCSYNSDDCHSHLFLDNTWYFAYKNLVAVLTFKAIEVLDIILPSPSMTCSNIKMAIDRDRLPEDLEEISFSDGTARFSSCYFSDQFKKLRGLVIKCEESNLFGSEEAFVSSLANSVPWQAKGGKSGSTFRKTADDRFILKEISSIEFDSFKNIAVFYFHYMEKAIVEGKKCALAKILGMYKVKSTLINSTTSKSLYVLVMENLFYQRSIKQKFDLKGSVRNRLAATSSDDEVVLLDENLIRMIREAPFYVKPSEKRTLQLAIIRDSIFLASHELIDYSLVVGKDEERNQLVVGIIDYIRSFTWHKKVETFVKSIPTKEKPTIVKPETYRDRFIHKMDQYFLAVPDSSPPQSESVM